MRSRPRALAKGSFAVHAPLILGGPPIWSFSWTSCAVGFFTGFSTAMIALLAWIFLAMTELALIDLPNNHTVPIEWSQNQKIRLHQVLEHLGIQGSWSLSDQLLLVPQSHRSESYDAATV